MDLDQEDSHCRRKQGEKGMPNIRPEIGGWSRWKLKLSVDVANKPTINGES